MAAHWLRRIAILVFVFAAAAAAVWALRPQPVPVDTARIARGTLELTISEEGRTRVREVYTVSAPVAGTLQRSPREVGDAVKAGETIVAIIRPTTPGFLDARSRREAEALVAAMQAMVESATAQVREAEAQRAYAQAEYARTAELHQRKVISDSRLAETRTAMATAEARVASAQATVSAYQYGLELAKARLVGPQAGERSQNDDESCCLVVRAPVDGQVLAVHHENEQVIASGTPLIDLGNPAELEVMAELLSTDAVRIKPNASARIDGWGGSRPLVAKVRHVEPAAFTKTSALGIEEQRVRVILDLEGPPEERRALGHGFRVMVHIDEQRIEDALLVPLGALFRRGDTWSVFTVNGEDRARERVVTIGERTNLQAVVLSGLEEGERVILHPSDRVSDGVSVRERDGG